MMRNSPTAGGGGGLDSGLIIRHCKKEACYEMLNRAQTWVHSLKQTKKREMYMTKYINAKSVLWALRAAEKGKDWKTICSGFLFQNTLSGI